MTAPATITDRCDRCGGQARYQVLLPTGLDLLLCLTHRHQHATAITGRYPMLPIDTRS